MTMKSTVSDMLFRHLSPPTIALVGSAFVTVHRGEPCRIRYVAGVWAHHYRSGTIVQPRIGGATASETDEVARDAFAYYYTPREGDIVFDVGAGVGGESRLFSHLVGRSGRVVAFEANPNTFRCLEMMVQLNKLPNVLASSYAISDQSGTVIIEDSEDNHLGNSLTDDNVKGVNVEARSLDDISLSLGIDRIDLLKMNIEGAELAALNGMSHMLTQTKNVAISCHDFRANATGLEWQRTVAPVTELLRDAGFDLDRRVDETRPWIRDTIYGTRRASSET